MLDVNLAQEIDSAFGADAAIGFEAKTNGKLLPPGETRAEAAIMLAAGTFIAQCAQLAVQVWDVRRSRDAVLYELASKADSSYDLKMSVRDTEKRLSYAAWLIDKLLPEKLFPSPLEKGAAKRTKIEWMAEAWRDHEAEGKRSMSASRVHKFADFPYQASTEPIGWEAEPGSDPRAPNHITMPALFVTDLASSPKCLWWAVPPEGKYGNAAMIHDWMYWSQYWDREAADLVFYEVMREFKVALPTCQLLWASVRVFGAKYWNAAHEEFHTGGHRILRRLPSGPKDGTVAWADWQKKDGVFAMDQRPRLPKISDVLAAG